MPTKGLSLTLKLSQHPSHQQYLWFVFQFPPPYGSFCIGTSSSTSLRLVAVQFPQKASWGSGFHPSHLHPAYSCPETTTLSTPQTSSLHPRLKHQTSTGGWQGNTPTHEAHQARGRKSFAQGQHLRRGVAERSGIAHRGQQLLLCLPCSGWVGGARFGAATSPLCSLIE